MRQRQVLQLLKADIPNRFLCGYGHRLWKRACIIQKESDDIRRLLALCLHFTKSETFLTLREPDSLRINEKRQMSISRNMDSSQFFQQIELIKVEERRSFPRKTCVIPIAASSTDTAS